MFWSHFQVLYDELKVRHLVLLNNPPPGAGYVGGVWKIKHNCKKIPTYVFINDVGSVKGNVLKVNNFIGCVEQRQICYISYYQCLTYIEKHLEVFVFRLFGRQCQKACTIVMPLVAHAWRCWIKDKKLFEMGLEKWPFLFVSLWFIGMASSQGKLYILIISILARNIMFLSVRKAGSARVSFAVATYKNRTYLVGFANMESS